ncbi:alpha-ketoglutarate-dependent dioxygenase AlkB family protein [Mucilaginibacter sp. NFX135]|uniref:alpha-ketoglutarate-dependent dioxygenase AlkB family protein n=1 Tax=Mucilaginibacter sp. NFX135 TaxID=3402687 RepID=UPI003AFA133F
MEQLSFFAEAGQSKGLPEELLEYRAGFVNHPWTPELLMIKHLVEPLAGVKFNSVLLNYYRDGNDSVAWRIRFRKYPVIASVSFGQVRSFDIRNKYNHSEKYSVRLEHGSFLLMKAGLQENWEHRIAKSIKSMKARINLTSRVVI